MKKLLILMVVGMFVTVGLGSVVSAGPDDREPPAPDDHRIPNQAPGAPVIIGDMSGMQADVYRCTFYSLDPEGDLVFYKIKYRKIEANGIWSMKPDEDRDIPWLGPFDSGEQVMKDQQFSEKGTWEVSLRAKDTYGNIGPASTITVTYGKSRDYQCPLLERILQRFPLMYELFERILSF